jgi:GNAT superfamily N-acetyltransferase
MDKVYVDEYSSLKQKFHEFIIRYPTINAVISNKQNGFVYSDYRQDNLFICAKHGWSLLIANDPHHIGVLFEFLKGNLDIPDYIHLYSPNKLIINYLEGNWPKYKIRERCQLRYLQAVSKSIKPDLNPAGLKIVKIQEVLFSKLDVFELDLDKRYWQSMEDFITNAIGVTLLNRDGDPVAICYSICIVDHIAEFEIIVLPEYRGKRLGWILTNAIIELAIENGLTPHWDAFTTNVASYELAKNVGFTAINTYDLVSIFLRDW